MVQVLTSETAWRTVPQSARIVTYITQRLRETSVNHECNRKLAAELKPRASSGESDDGQGKSRDESGTRDNPPQAMAQFSPPSIEQNTDMQDLLLLDPIPRCRLKLAGPTVKPEIQRDGNK